MENELSFMSILFSFMSILSLKLIKWNNFVLRM